MKYVIGITGSIACGKSFVTSTLRNLGYPTIDTDKISHDLTADGSVANEALALKFPEAINNGRLNRKILGEIVFNDKIRREELNHILHPLIYQMTEELINKYDGIIFVDVPLMFEAHFDKLCDKIICVYTSYESQIERLMSRDSITYEEAIKKINSQMPLKDKMEKSDFLLKSEENFDDTVNNIKIILNKIREEYYAKTA